MTNGTNESPSWYGGVTFALLDPEDPDFERPITLDFVSERLQHDPDMLAIAHRIGERAMPLESNPLFLDEIDEAGHRSITLVIPGDDPEAMKYYDERVLVIRAAIGALEN